jgi:hypothetical protein
MAGKNLKKSTAAVKQSAAVPIRVENKPAHTLAQVSEDDNPVLRRMREQQLEALDAWGLFAELLEDAAGLARMVEREIKDGGFHNEAANAALILALDAAEANRVEALRGDRHEQAYVIDDEAMACDVAKRLLCGKVA